MEEQNNQAEIKRDTDLFETIFITILVGILGSIFIMGTFVWQEIQLEKQMNQMLYSSSQVK